MQRRQSGPSRMQWPSISAGVAGEVILVVEDDPLMLRVTTEAVRELGYTALYADNAAAALAILPAGRIQTSAVGSLPTKP
jgi:hypothetical protein